MQLLTELKLRMLQNDNDSEYEELFNHVTELCGGYNILSSKDKRPDSHMYSHKTLFKLWNNVFNKLYVSEVVPVLFSKCTFLF